MSTSSQNTDQSKSSPSAEAERLRILEASGLLDSSPEQSFDRLTKIAMQLLDAPVALISLLDKDRQFFKSAQGLPEPWESQRETPLSHSFCKHVVALEKPFVVGDAGKDPLVCDNLAVRDLNVVAYAGVPLRIDKVPVGSFCVIDTKSRDWTDGDITTLTELSEIVENVIEQRHQIDELMRARQEMDESQARLTQILNSTGEGIYGIDEDGNCTFANAKCVELLGYETEEAILGGNMHDLAHHSRLDGTAYPKEECHIIKAYRQGQGVNIADEVFWKADGGSFPVEYWSYLMKAQADGGAGSHSTTAVVTFVDISSRLEYESKLIKAKRSAENANRQKSRFLANMSHEIRTPMNAILGFGELLEGLTESPKALRYVQAIRSSGEALLDLINDILDLSKIESGKLELFEETIDVRAFADSIHLLFSQQAAEKNIELSVKVASDCPDYLVYDELRMRQILLNLISNAVKFTDKGWVRVSIDPDARHGEEEHVGLTMKVMDSGRGIPEEHLPNLFKPFKQIDEADAEAGSGLGLSICQKLVRLMGGTIDVESNFGEGSTFKVSIPRLRVDAAPDLSLEDGPRVVNMNNLAPSRILIVDDNASNRELAAAYLDGSHHTVAFAENGKEAIDANREFRPDVVLMDIRMPVLDGREARLQIKQDPAFEGLPVVAVTASSLLRDSLHLQKEFEGFIRKPFSKAQLYEALSAFISGAVETVIEDAEQISEDVDDVNVEEWKVCRKILEEWKGARVSKLRQTMAMGEVAEFACELYEWAENVQSSALASYARELRDCAEGFASKKVEALLKEFSPLLEKLTLQYGKS